MDRSNPLRDRVTWKYSLRPVDASGIIRALHRQKKLHLRSAVLPVAPASQQTSLFYIPLTAPGIHDLDHCRSGALVF